MTEIQVDNDKLDAELLKEACQLETPEKSLQSLLEQQEDKGFNKDRSVDVSHRIDQEAANEINAWLDTQSTILRIDYENDTLDCHLAGIDDLNEILVTSRDFMQLASHQMVWFADQDDIRAMLYDEADIGKAVTREFDSQEFTFLFAPYMEDMKNQYEDELHTLAQRGTDGFVSSEGLALTQVADYGLKGELSSEDGRSAYNVIERQELDYDIDLQGAEEALPSGTSGLSEAQKERAFNGIMEIASEAEETISDQDWDLGVYETEESEALLYMEDHDKQTVHVLGYDENSNDEEIYDIEVLGGTAGYNSECARKQVYENRDPGVNLNVATPLLNLAINPADTRSKKVDPGLGGDTVQVRDVAATKNKEDKELTKENDIWAGDGDKARVGGRVT